MEQVKVIDLPTMSEELWQECKRRTDEEWARVKLPAGWVERIIQPDDFVYGCRAAQRGKTGLLFSVGCIEGQWWLHVSVAHPNKIPPYLDLCLLHEVFIGHDRQALQIFPARKEHVNIHPRALHLWCRLDGDDGIPHFGEYGTI